MTSNKKVLTVCTIIGMIVLFSVTAFGATRYVPSQYSTIQAAVNAAANWDTIIVSSGTYYENVEIGKPLTIRSQNGSTYTRLDPQGNTGFEIKSDNVTIDGFSISGGRSGILLTEDFYTSSSANYCTIINNNITGCTSGIKILGSFVSNGINNCTIRYNNCSYNSAIGIYMVRAKNNNISNNTCNSNGGNKWEDGEGIMLFSESDNNNISNNTCNDNSIGIMLRSGSSGNTISNNSCSDNYDAGIFIWTDGNTISNNYIYHTKSDCMGRLYVTSYGSGTYLEIPAGARSNTFYGNNCVDLQPPYMYLSDDYGSGVNNRVRFYGCNNGQATHGYATCRGSWWVNPCQWTSGCSTGWEWNPADYHVLGDCSSSWVCD